MEHSEEIMVGKYFAGTDTFINVKSITEEHLKKLFMRIPKNKSEYKSWIANSLVLNIDKIYSRATKRNIMDRETVTELLYQAVVDVNPLLEINQVEIPFTIKTESRSQSCRNNIRGELTNFDRKFRKRIIGQEQVVIPLINAISRYLYGIRDLSKPAGVFLLPGPTGSGKTETAKVVQDLLFGGRIIPIDCSEYALPHEIAKLIGSPPGYVGHANEGGRLTDEIRKYPNSVVLFDEIEKAHDNLFKILYQIFDEGRLTDGKGDVANFNNSFIFLTSNLGCDEVENYSNRMGFESDNQRVKNEEIASIYQRVLQDRFGKALLNRVDKVIVYNPLTLESAVRVADIEAKKEAGYFTNAGVKVSYTINALEEIVRRADFRTFGGRDIKRVISSQVSDRIIGMINSGKVKDGNNVRVGYRGSEFTYSVK